MKLEDTCKILLEKGKTQKIKCYRFFQTDMERELAVHPDIDHKGTTSITDTQTGLRLCSIPVEMSKVTDKDIDETLNKFIKHFTIEALKAEFTRLAEKEK